MESGLRAGKHFFMAPETFLAEEMLLLMHDEESGAVSAPSDRALRFALAGSVLLDLAHAKPHRPGLRPHGRGRPAVPGESIST